MFRLFFLPHSLVPSEVLVRRVFGVLLGKKFFLSRQTTINKHTQMQKRCFLNDRRFFFTLRLRLKDLFGAFVMLGKTKPDSMRRLIGIDRH